LHGRTALLFHRKSILGPTNEISERELQFASDPQGLVNTGRLLATRALDPT
jgi:hypothetical protein